MPLNSSTLDHRAMLQAAFEELRLRRAEIEALRPERSGPVAILGIACRFPGGVETPRDFWELLERGVDAIGEVPRDRWDIDSYDHADLPATGKMATRWGGFLRQVDQFDAPFFGISVREAASIDPQHRLLLEVAWEAIENAGLAAERLYQSLTGVFVGITCFDHALRLAKSPELFSSHAVTGSALNMAAGRLSYLLGFTGPSMAVDTACSSSLVCLHLACQSLRSGDSDLALAGGVHLMLSPDVMDSFSRAHMLAPDGRSKAFDAAADGYARGEGCGIAVLKRLSEALRDGDPILGVIRGSAVNQDGPSGGLTIPSCAAQQRVIRRALAQAGVTPREIAYVEAHGTGTSLGDPIEIEALAAVYGEGRDLAHPLLVGTAKSNIGHLEPAAGMAGLSKVLLSMQHGTIPPNLHFNRPNPHVAWSETPIYIPTQSTPWPGGKRLAGVSAFGFSGTNAHLIVEQAPAREEAAPAPRGTPQLLTLSAKSENALKALAERYAMLLSSEDVDLAAVCREAATGRSHFPVRWAAVATDAASMRDKLAADSTSLRSQAEPHGTNALQDLATSYISGAKINWPEFYAGAPRRPVMLPNYPFQRQRHWLDVEAPGSVRSNGLHRLEWEPLAAGQSPALVEGSRWLLVADRGGFGQTFADLLFRNRQDVVLAPGAEAVRSLLEFAPEYVVFFPGLDAPPARELTLQSLERCQQEGCGALLQLLQAAIRSGGTSPRFWIVTRDAVEAGRAPKTSALAQSPLWGLAKVTSLELPDLYGGCIDLDATQPAGEAQMLMQEIAARGREDQIAFRENSRFAPRLVESSASPEGRPSISPQATYLISGGFGALGLEVAQWLAQEGAENLVLLGRNGATTRAAEQTISALRADGVTVECERLDVSDESAMLELFGRLKNLRGIVHAAGLPGYQQIGAISAPGMQAVLRPKVMGAWLLHTLSRERTLDFFVCFSSIASVWGSREQAHYAAANRFLDSLAHHRRALGLPALTVNWGPWTEGGMNSAASDTLLRRVGVKTIPASHALLMLGRLLGAGATQAVVADVDWKLFKGSYEARGNRPLLARIGGGEASATHPTKDSRLAAEIRSAPATERRRLLLEFVRSETAQVLGFGSAWPETDQGFFQMGMDSLLALEFRTRLEAALGGALAATLVFDYPTIQSLTEHLLKQVAAETFEATEGAKSGASAGMQSLTERIEQLSEEEAEALLLQKLGAMSGI